MSEKEQEKGREEENCHKIRHGGGLEGNWGQWWQEKCTDEGIGGRTLYY